jgi:hypothetical protein
MNTEAPPLDIEPMDVDVAPVDADAPPPLRDVLEVPDDDGETIFQDR